MSNAITIRSPAKRKLGERPLHEINLQYDTKQILVIGGITIGINRKFG
jgi:hypothetical protein